jgi:CxxC motif-containing protein (DUF1111 family)
MKRYLLSMTTTGIAATALFGCAAGDDATTAPATAETNQLATAALGSALPGTDATRFDEARANFMQAEDIHDGLGPTFNETACGHCHNIGAVGGSGTQIERRFGKVTNGVFYGYDQPGDNQGGTLRQLSSNDPYLNGTVSCTIPLDKEPADATVHNVGRRSLPLFGLGLVDAMPDGFFDLLAALEPSATRGTVLRSIPQFPDSRDPNQGLNKTRVQRFGIKDQQTNLVSFSGDAYINEMGISTQSCYKGTSILAFANENYPNNKAPKAGCNGGDLALAQTIPGVPVETDDAVGACVDGTTKIDEVQDDLANFLFFMEHLAPPPSAALDPVTAVVGAFLFVASGCGDCHTPLPFVTPSAPPNGVPGNFVFFPFSDFLVHDMGSLGDGIGNTGDSVAKTRLMRTAPLWGVRFNTQLLHDGRAGNVRAAILAHDGQGLAAKTTFAGLGSTDQAILVAFVNAL